MNAEIISVGTELLLGDILNTNAQYLSKNLAGMGISVKHISTVGDNWERVTALVKEALERSDFVITTGGLGPTDDDLTKEACCKAAGIELEFSEECLRRIESYFKKRNMKMAETNVKQAYVPKNGTVFMNENGTAPGCAFEKEGKHVIMLPGPPSEMKPMFENSVFPYLQRYINTTIFSNNIYISGIGESLAAEKVRDLLESENPTVAPYASTGEVRLRVTAMAPNTDAAREMCAPVVEEIKRRLGSFVYGVDCGSLQEKTVAMLSERGIKLAVAESCTGGLIAKRITDVSGSSSVFECGIVSYSNEIKRSVLGVSSETLERYGAVSCQTAEEMARGVKRISGADIAVSSTGIAGPTGGTDCKPVGLAYVSVCGDDGCVVREVRGAVEGNRREYNRTVTSAAALKLVIDYLNGIRE